MLPCYILTFLFDGTRRHTMEPNVTSCSWVPMSPFRDGFGKKFEVPVEQVGSNLTASRSVSLAVPSDQILPIASSRGEKEKERLME